MKIIAHRGNKRYAPENTMAAFYSAMHYDIEGIEFDLHLTKDYVPVIIHDPTIDRTTDGRGPVSSFTMNELKQFDAGRSFDESFIGEKIPSFREFLIWAQDYSFTLHLELKQQKSNSDYFLKEVVKELEAFDMIKRTVISSFQHNYLPKVKALNPMLETALLTKTPIFKAVKYAEKVSADGIHIRYNLQNSRFFRRWSKKGAAVRAYHVQKPAQLILCEKLGVEAVITNDPRRMSEFLKQK
ncbi:glycerophosphodiester phosphodiesterase [Salisediminibacterium beveridgei]|uniref:Glycerophosphoryl diester phosphodiesterase n=1 Tax=Salisediminibacterium beveridgei TaxID=632773 RepID=A0A1D7QUA5_9BACI|nr:glycerophosphodiester phosphodiesterase family protein [Salisediminibacterium beveridgei]AOM82602.1 Glycerophosphoryl diester phosphodiesterase [Salisediminibacterium beveridgei]